MKHNWSIIWRACQVSLKTKNQLSIGVSIIGFGIAFLPVLVAGELRKLTDTLQLLMSDHSELLNAVRIFGLLVTFFIVQAIFDFLQSYTNQIDQLSTYHFIKKTILQHKCEVAYRYIENDDRFHERVAFADSYAGKQVANSIQDIILLIQRTMTFISVSYALYQVNPLIVLILLAATIPAVILAYQQKDENFRYQTKFMEEGHLVIHYFFICCGKDGMQEVRHYRLFDYLKARWRAIADDYCGKKNLLTIKHVKYNSGADFLRNVVYIAVLLVTAAGIYQNPIIGLGTFTLVFALSGQMQDVTASLFTGIMQFFNSIPYMNEFFYLDSLPKDHGSDMDVQLTNGEIDFADVSFSYPNTDVQVLKDINVHIQDGEKVAIVGENGSGKSTFISLLCGMFEPDSGTVSIAGQPIARHLAAARNTISVVFQDFGRYETTIRNNITVSDKNRPVNDQEILDLAKRVNALDVIDSQKNGLDERIGSASDKGNDLSGGQWQKISLMRATYRQNARIMILDEPTAALDPLAETQLYTDFSKITGKRTTILISHRLGITSVVDRILVFMDGRIVEDGSHKELMRRNGVYARMYQAQAQWYEA